MRSNISGVGSYNSEYRRFNRTFGRGNPRPFQRQSSPQRIRRSDLFVEAGRLAVEYLVSHGLLSSNVLSGQSHNGILRNDSGEFQTHRWSQDREISNSYVDGRPVSMGHQRAASPDGTSGRRRSPNDQDLSLSRNSYLRDTRRNGIARSNSYEWSHEIEREGSLSCIPTASEGTEADHDKFPMETSNDAALDACGSCPAESASKDDRHNQLQDEMGKSISCDDSDSKMTSMLQEKDVDSKMTSMLQEKDVKELSQPSGGVDAGCRETGELNKGEETLRGVSVEHYKENNGISKGDCTNQRKLCSSAQIPTEGHTSLSNKSPSSDVLMLGDGTNAGDTGCDSVKSTKDATIKGSSEIPSSNENHSSISVGMGLSKHSFRDVASDQKKAVEALLFAGGSFSYEEKSNGLPELGSCGEDRGEKRHFEDENMGERAKRAKEWLSVAQSNEYSRLSDLGGKQCISQATKTAPVNIFNDCANQENFADVSFPLKGSVVSTIEQGEQKQLFSSSFKICDLNLMEASDMRESQDVSGLLYPTMSGPGKNAAVDVDLSMNNNYSFTSGYNDGGAARKDIEVIDLEGASLQENRNVDTSTSNMAGDIANMGSFPNNSQNCNDNPDAQDGYGFMISELLGNDVPNCSSVQSDINSLHNEMGLHHGEGIFSEDDQIFMSLGEIPISLLRGWEQTTQERNPFEL